MLPLTLGSTLPVQLVSIGGMANDQVGFAIVGTGMIAGVHAQAIGEVAGADLVAVVSRNAERGANFAGRHGATMVVESVEALADCDDVHVVAVTTPSGGHLEPTLAAINAGKHVVVEKPLEISVARVDRMLKAAVDRNGRIMPIFQQRLSAGAQKVKAAVEAGRFGRMTLASCYVKWFRDADYYASSDWKGTQAMDGGGALMNQGIHGVDLLQWLVGLPVEVSARTTRRLHESIEVEDTAVAQLRFPDGALGTIEASTAAWPGWALRIELCGEKGSVRLEDGVITAWEFADSRPGDERVLGGNSELGSGASNPSGISIEGHVRQVRAMVAAFRSGKAPEIDGPEGRGAVALIEAIYQSAAAGGAPTTVS